MVRSLPTYVFLSAKDHVVQHEELVHVEQDPGEVADQEEDDDAQQDGRQVHLWGPLLVPLLGPLVGHLDAAEDVRVEVDEGNHRDHPGGDQPGPVDVKSMEEDVFFYPNWAYWAFFAPGSSQYTVWDAPAFEGPDKGCSNGEGK